jgi:hypothetical protein
MKSLVPLLLVALLQCYATRTQSGCKPLSYHHGWTDCSPLARQFQREDNRALVVTGLPVAVHYRCVTIH